MSKITLYTYIEVDSEKEHAAESSNRPVPSHKLQDGKFVDLLKENFVELSGSEINQSDVFDVLNLDESKKIIATKAMKEAFSSVLVSRRRKEGVTVYKNVARKRSFELDSSESSLQLNETSEIKNIKQVIALVTAELQDVTRRLNDHLSDDKIEKDIVCTLVVPTKIT